MFRDKFGLEAAGWCLVQGISGAVGERVKGVKITNGYGFFTLQCRLLARARTGSNGLALVRTGPNGFRYGRTENQEKSVKNLSISACVGGKTDPNVSGRLRSGVLPGVGVFCGTMAVVFGYGRGQLLYIRKTKEPFYHICSCQRKSYIRSGRLAWRSGFGEPNTQAHGRIQ